HAAQRDRRCRSRAGRVGSGAAPAGFLTGARRTRRRCHIKPNATMVSGVSTVLHRGSTRQPQPPHEPVPAWSPEGADLVPGCPAPASPLPHQTQCHEGERRQHDAPWRIDATAAATARANASLESGRGRAGAGLLRAVGEVGLLLWYVAVVGGRAAGADAATRCA